MFDGNLDKISAYDAAKRLAYDTTFDIDGGGLTAVWMDLNYNWGNPIFQKRVGESLNLAVNYIADVLHTLYLQSETEDFSLTFPLESMHLWFVGVAITTIAIIVIVASTRRRLKQPKGRLIRLF